MSHPLVRSKCRPNSGQRFEGNGQQYELRGRLGDGAAGLVRKGCCISTNKTIAVKFLAPDPKYVPALLGTGSGNTIRSLKKKG